MTTSSRRAPASPRAPRRLRKRAPAEDLRAVVDECIVLADRLVWLAEHIHGDEGRGAVRRGILRGLARYGAQTVPEMARTRSVTRQNVQPVVDALVAEGLVVRVPNPAHRRSPRYEVTAEGRAIAARMDHDPEPLSVHPILERDGIGGGYAAGLAEIVLRYAGADALHKATFITIDAPIPEARGGEVWTFGAVVEHDGVWEPLEIPAFGTATTAQRLVSIGPAPTLPESSFDVSITPALPPETDLSGLFGTGAVADATSAQDVYELALELENPLLRSADDSDCITCHITHARRRGELLLGLTVESEPAFYAEGASLGTSTVRSAVGVRAMGWSVFAPRPETATPDERASRALSQRVINETAYTLARLATMLEE